MSTVALSTSGIRLGPLSAPVGTPAPVKGGSTKSSSAHLLLDSVIQLLRCLPSMAPPYKLEKLTSFLKETNALLVRHIKRGIFSEEGSPLLLEMIEASVEKLPSLEDPCWEEMSELKLLEPFINSLYSLLLITGYAGSGTDPASKGHYSHSASLILSYWIYALIDKGIRKHKQFQLEGFKSASLPLLFAVKNPSFTATSKVLHEKLKEALSYFHPTYRLDQDQIDLLAQGVSDVKSALFVYEEHLKELFDDSTACSQSKYYLEEGSLFLAFLRKITPEGTPLTGAIELPGLVKILMQASWVCSLLAQAAIQLKKELFNLCSPKEANLPCLFKVHLTNENYAGYALQVSPSDGEKIQTSLHLDTFTQFSQLALGTSSYTQPLLEHHFFTQGMSDKEKADLSTLLLAKAQRGFFLAKPDKIEVFGLSPEASTTLLGFLDNPYESPLQLLEFCLANLKIGENKGFQYFVFLQLFSYGALNALQERAKTTLYDKLFTLCTKAQEAFSTPEKIRSALFFLSLALAIDTFYHEPSLIAPQVAHILTSSLLPIASDQKSYRECLTLLLIAFSHSPEEEATPLVLFAEEVSDLCYFPFFPSLALNKTLQCKYKLSLIRGSLRGLEALRAHYSALAAHSSQTAAAGTIFDQLSTLLNQEESSFKETFFKPAKKKQLWKEEISYFTESWDTAYSIWKRLLTAIVKTFRSHVLESRWYQKVKATLKLFSIPELVLIASTGALLISKISSFVLSALLLLGALFFSWKVALELCQPYQKLYLDKDPTRDYQILLSGNAYTEKSAVHHVLLIQEKENDKTHRKAILLHDFDSAFFARKLREEKMAPSGSKKIALVDMNSRAILAQGKNAFTKREMEPFSHILNASIEVARKRFGQSTSS